MMTKDQYIESLRKMNLKVYLMGEKIENPVDHPMIRPSMNSVAMTYELAEKEEYKDLMTATSNLTGKTIIPLELFINEKGLAKMEIALCQGKHTYDKRQSLREADDKKQMDQLKKRIYE